MTTDEGLRKQVRHAEHEYKIHQMEQQRLKKEKEGTWSWIKREVLFAEKMTDKELFKLTIQYVVSFPFVIAFIWMIFAIGYAFGRM